MSLLTMIGIMLVIIGIGLLGASARYFYLGFKALYSQSKIKENLSQQF